MIIHGNSLEELKKLEDNSVDSIVCDPPYELGFMGKEWDNTGIAYSVELWKECLRVVKEGGHLLAFSGTRTYHRMAVAIEDAGFEIRDMIEWLYFSGFPKSHDVSKALDKMDAKEERRKRNLAFTSWMRSTGIKAKDVNKELLQKGMTTEKSNLAGHFFGDSQPIIPTLHMWNAFKNIINVEVPEWVEQMIHERTIESENFKKREVVGQVKTKNLTNNAQTTFLGEGSTLIDITAPSTDEAKQWNGWGTALKPAHEPIVMARKPFKGTVADNVLKHGTGAINVDGCRIKTEDEQGRFPANCITLEEDAFYSKYFNITPKEISKKASKKDRNSDYQGNEINGEEKQTGHGNLQKSGGFERFNTFNKNNHPTVKPIPLMEWLITLVTPQNGTVLDPFAGSGSTLVAAKRLGFSYIGIELTEEYIEIIKARLRDE